MSSSQPTGGDNLDAAANDPSSRALLHLQIRDYFSWLLATKGRGKKVLEAMELEFPDLIGAGTLDLARVPYLLQASRYFGSAWERNVHSRSRQQHEPGEKGSRKRKARDLSDTGPAEMSLSRRKATSQSGASSKKYSQETELTHTGEDANAKFRKGAAKAINAKQRSTSSSSKKDVRNATSLTHTAGQITASSKGCGNLVPAVNTDPGANNSTGSQLEGGTNHQSLRPPPAALPPMEHMHQNAMNYHHQQMMQRNMALQAHHASQNPGYGFMFAQNIPAWSNFSAGANGPSQSLSHPIVRPAAPK